MSILEDVEVRGTLWLVGELTEANVITVNQTARAYDAMREDGSRLPWKEVDAQIKKIQEPIKRIGDVGKGQKENSNQEKSSQ